MKTIFKHSGAFTWKDSVRLAVSHPDHPSFFVNKLWSYFVAGTPDAATANALQAALRLERASDPAGRDRDPQAPCAL